VKATILVGDVLVRFPELVDRSIDSIVTDPPYELGFMGKQWDKSGIAVNVDVWRECLRVLKPGGHLLSFGGSRTYHRMACAIEDAGLEIRDQIMWIYGSGFPKSLNIGKGMGTALKPAHEPICVARKSLRGTVAANVAKYGTGALNIDACRIDGEKYSSHGERPDMRGGNYGRAGACKMPRRKGEESADRRYAENGATNFAATPGYRGGDPAGRWPANVIHDGSEEVVGGFPQTESGYSDGTKSGIQQSVFGKYGAGTFKPTYGDSGSAARFFYCAKADRDERNAGCYDVEEKPLLWSSDAQRPGTFQAEGTHRAARNNHPTVKPIDLMRYLCRLVTPPNGTVLDPFMGSGSIGIAALLEGFNFIGIEISPDYAAIAERRMQTACPMFNQVEVRPLGK